jgi:hypothetical protein
MGKRVDVCDFSNQLFFLVQQTFYACQNNQQVGIRKDGDFGGKPIIVPEAKFFHGYRIIFIDNRDDVPETEQTLQRIFRVLVPASAIDILMAQEQLGHVKSMSLKQ